MSNDNYISDTFKTIGAILVALLPFLQFGFVFLPVNITGLYVEKQSFFFASLVTLLLSVFVVYAYLSKPYFRFYPNYKKYREYLQSLSDQQEGADISRASRSDISSRPFEVTAGTVAMFSIVVFFIASLSFIWIGLNFDETSITPKYSFLQSFLYIIIFVSAVYVLLHFSHSLYRRKQWKKIRRERIQNAINLAIENQAFVDFPQIVFEALVEQPMGQAPHIIVQVKVGERRYRIYSSIEADELYEVQEVGSQ